MELHKLASLLLETILHRLSVESVHLTYGVSVSAREIIVSTSSIPKLHTPISPYDWEGPGLPRSIFRDGEYVLESIYFGDLGSASLLRLINKDPVDAILDSLIVEHCKLHAALHESYGYGIKEFQLNHSERQALYWGARGLTAKETAEEMKINFRSVEYYLKTAKDKLGAQNLPEAIHKAVCTRQLRI